MFGFCRPQCESCGFGSFPDVVMSLTLPGRGGAEYDLRHIFDFCVSFVVGWQR